jgi:hypothetical protein
MRERAVIAIRKDGVLCRFDGVREAARITDVQASNIVACLKGRLRTAGGYGWKYVEDFYAEKKPKTICSMTVKVPCKIGDCVWGVRNYRGMMKPSKGIVSGMFFTDDMELRIVVRNICQGEWGKEIFATRKEAFESIGVFEDDD